MTGRAFFMLSALLAAFITAAPANAQQATPAAATTATPVPATAPPRSLPVAPPTHEPPKPSLQVSATPSPTPGPPFGNMQWREIGPALPGGRVAAVAGSTSDPNLYYLGSAGGGVWKSTDGGETWSAVFEKQSVAAIGAVAIDPTHENVVWVGTGEANPAQRRLVRQRRLQDDGRRQALAARGSG